MQSMPAAPAAAEASRAQHSMSTQMTEQPILVYLALLLAIWSVYLYRRHGRQRQAIRDRQEATDAGLLQPASLHPVINGSACIGCRSCISACPEKNVLGLINDRAELVTPANCIGHGACRTACPMQAITLVFGTAERGVDIPLLSADFETSVPGIYIAGELGGMGLIRNAVEQGRQAMEAIARNRRADADVDVAIIGAGPAGIAATLAAKQHGLSYLTLEQDSLGGTVAHYPRGKIVMTAPVTLPIVGKMNFREVSKEALLAFWQDIISRSGIDIGFNRRVESIRKTGEAFEITAAGTTLRAASVLLAIGRRGTPRKLGVPGEEQARVVYRMIDPAQYRNKKVLVVGGGDSAIEAATEIAEQPGSSVSLSYRGDAVSRAKPKNRIRLEKLVGAGRIRLLLSSSVTSIGATDVKLECRGESIVLPNDAVIVCAGGILPTPFLKATGIEVETRYGTA
jgi:thioredoxin reductase (NADPH)